MPPDDKIRIGIEIDKVDLSNQSLRQAKERLTNVFAASFNDATRNLKGFLASVNVAEKDIRKILRPFESIGNTLKNNILFNQRVEASADRGRKVYEQQLNVLSKIVRETQRRADIESQGIRAAQRRERGVEFNRLRSEAISRVASQQSVLRSAIQQGGLTTSEAKQAERRLKTLGDQVIRLRTATADTFKGPISRLEKVGTGTKTTTGLSEQAELRRNARKEAIEVNKASLREVGTALSQASRSGVVDQLELTRLRRQRLSLLREREALVGTERFTVREQQRIASVRQRGVSTPVVGTQTTIDRTQALRDESIATKGIVAENKKQDTVLNALNKEKQSLLAKAEQLLKIETALNQQYQIQASLQSRIAKTPQPVRRANLGAATLIQNLRSIDPQQLAGQARQERNRLADQAFEAELDRRLAAAGATRQNTGTTRTQRRLLDRQIRDQFGGDRARFAGLGDVRSFAPSLTGIDTKTLGSAKQSLNDVNKEVASLQKQVSANEKALLRQAVAFDKTRLTAAKFGDQIGLAVRRYSAFLLGTSGLFVVLNSFRLATDEALKFEKAQTRLSQILQVNREQVAGIVDEAREASTLTGVAASEALRGVDILAQAGFKSITDLSKAAQLFSRIPLTATFGSVEETADGLIAVFSQFNKQLSDTEDIFNLLNRAAADYAVEVKDIFAAVKRGGSTFAETGGTFEEFVELFTLLRSRTRESAETLGVFFKTLGFRLFSKQNEQLLESLGVTADDITGKFIQLSEAFEGLFGANSKDPAAIRLIEQIAGVRQGGRLIALLGAIQSDQGKFARTAAGISGSFSSETSKRAGDIAVSFQRIQQSINSIVSDITQNNLLRTVFASLADLATSFSKLGSGISTIAPAAGLLLGGLAARGATRAFVPAAQRFGFFGGEGRRVLAQELFPVAPSFSRPGEDRNLRRRQNFEFFGTPRRPTNSAILGRGLRRFGPGLLGAGIGLGASGLVDSFQTDIQNQPLTSGVLRTQRNNNRLSSLSTGLSAAVIGGTIAGPFGAVAGAALAAAQGLRQLAKDTQDLRTLERREVFDQRAAGSVFNQRTIGGLFAGLGISGLNRTESLDSLKNDPRTRLALRRALQFDTGRGLSVEELADRANRNLNVGLFAERQRISSRTNRILGREVDPTTIPAIQKIDKEIEDTANQLLQLFTQLDKANRKVIKTTEDAIIVASNAVRDFGDAFVTLISDSKLTLRNVTDRVDRLLSFSGTGQASFALPNVSSQVLSRSLPDRQLQVLSNFSDRLNDEVIRPLRGELTSNNLEAIRGFLVSPEINRTLQGAGVSEGLSDIIARSQFFSGIDTKTLAETLLQGGAFAFEESVTQGLRQAQELRIDAIRKEREALDTQNNILNTLSKSLLDLDNSISEVENQVSNLRFNQILNNIQFGLGTGSTSALAAPGLLSGANSQRIQELLNRVAPTNVGTASFSLLRLQSQQQLNQRVGLATGEPNVSSIALLTDISNAERTLAAELNKAAQNVKFFDEAVGLAADNTRLAVEQFNQIRGGLIEAGQAGRGNFTNTQFAAARRLLGFATSGGNQNLGGLLNQQPDLFNRESIGGSRLSRGRRTEGFQRFSNQELQDAASIFGSPQLRNIPIGLLTGGTDQTPAGRVGEQAIATAGARFIAEITQGIRGRPATDREIQAISQQLLEDQQKAFEAAEKARKDETDLRVKQLEAVEELNSNLGDQRKFLQDQLSFQNDLNERLLKGSEDFVLNSSDAIDKLQNAARIFESAVSKFAELSPAGRGITDLNLSGDVKVDVNVTADSKITKLVGNRIYNELAVAIEKAVNDKFNEPISIPLKEENTGE